MPNVVNEIATLTLADIHVDETENVRKSYDEGEHKGLVASIRREGLTQTLTVRPMNEGEEHGKPWVLLAGYRRMRALTELKHEKANCTIIRDVDKQRGTVINLVENVNRESLTPYEMAVGFKRLKDEFGMSAEEISKTIKGESLDGKGKSKQNVSNLMRLLRDLHPDIVKAWEAKHEKASTFNLLSIVAKGDHEAQWTLWEAYCGIGGDEDENEDESDGDDNEEESNTPAKPKCRPAVEVVAAMALIRKAMKDEKITAEDGKTMIETLRWVLKKRKTIPGVKANKESEAA